MLNNWYFYFIDSISGIDNDWGLVVLNCTTSKLI